MRKARYIYQKNCENDQLYVFCNDCTEEEIERLFDICKSKAGMLDILLVQKSINDEVSKMGLPFICECSRHMTGFLRI